MIDTIAMRDRLRSRLIDDLPGLPPPPGTLAYDPAWDFPEPAVVPEKMPELLLVGSSITGAELYHGKTVQGHWVIYWYGEPVCLLLSTNIQFLRLKLLGNHGIRTQVEVRAQGIRSQIGWNPAEFVECDEFHWAGALKWAVGMRPEPPTTRSQT